MVKDPRDLGKVKHLLEDVLRIALLKRMCNLFAGRKFKKRHAVGNGFRPRGVCACGPTRA